MNYNPPTTAPGEPASFPWRPGGQITNKKPMKIEIKDRFDGSLLFTHDCPENNIKITVQAALAAKADLGGANLGGADLGGADLRGAILSDTEKVSITSSRPCLRINSLGSRNDELFLWLTDEGPFVRAGCFWGTLEEFEVAVKKKHGDNEHAREYVAALALFRVHVELWGDK